LTPMPTRKERAAPARSVRFRTASHNGSTRRYEAVDDDEALRAAGTATTVVFLSPLMTCPCSDANFVTGPPASVFSLVLSQNQLGAKYPRILEGFNVCPTIALRPGNTPAVG
jgi:hypothetical protein